MFAQRTTEELDLPSLTANNAKPEVVAEGIYKSVCIACHSIDGTKTVGPTLKGIFGRKQRVIRNGKSIDLTIDDAYLHRALIDPLHEYPEGYSPAMPALNLPEQDRKACKLLSKRTEPKLDPMTYSLKDLRLLYSALQNTLMILMT